MVEVDLMGDGADLRETARIASTCSGRILKGEERGDPADADTDQVRAGSN
jgi:hypothetical protein